MYTFQHFKLRNYLFKTLYITFFYNFNTYRLNLESPPNQPHSSTYTSAILYTLLRQPAATSIKLPTHAPRPSHIQTKSSSKSSKPAPKPAYTPPFNPPKNSETSLNNHLPENSPKSSIHFLNIAPSLLKTFPKTFHFYFLDTSIF